MKFYYIYVLESKEKKILYIGYSENLQRRYEYHTQGKVQSTKHYRPLQLIHYEAYVNKEDAKRRELYLKTSRGKTTLKTMLKTYFEKSQPG